MADRDSGRPPAAAFHRVETHEQARLLLDEDAQAVFRAFLARETTVTGAARETERKPAAVLYRVGTLLDAGLLRVVREEPRAGRPVKVYRSTHDAYLVPYALTPFASLEETFYALYEQHAREIARLVAARFRRGWEGYRLYRDAFGETWMEGAPDAERLVELDDPERPPGLDYFVELDLTRDEAREVQETLRALLRRFRSERVADGRGSYVLSVALAGRERPS